MRGLHLLPLLPAVLAAPAQHAVPELSLKHWSSIQSGFVDRLRSLSSWSWGKAEEAVEDLSGLGIDKTGQTIWQQLKADNNTFSRLIRLVEFEETVLKDLDDQDSDVTFFAPNNDALRPAKHGHGNDADDDLVLEELMREPSLSALSAALEREPTLMVKDDDDDDEEKKRRREFLKTLVRLYLRYHILPKAYTAQELAQNSTFATVLEATDGSYGGQYRRIRVSKQLRSLSIIINLSAKVVGTDRKARNGIIQVIDHGLHPPMSILTQLYRYFDAFSDLTSAVGKLDYKEQLEWTYDRNASEPGNATHSGTGLLTLFAANNAAFARLPSKLGFYLFSPWGEQALRKIISYHISPNVLLFSDFFYSENKTWSEVETTVSEHSDLGDPSFHKEFKVPTCLTNATLDVVIDKTRIVPIEGGTKTTMTVNGIIVTELDVPASNGVAHVIDNVLMPPHHRAYKGEDIGHLDSWENWEEWLLDWAESA